MAEWACKARIQEKLVIFEQFRRDLVSNFGNRVQILRMWGGAGS